MRKHFLCMIPLLGLTSLQSFAQPNVFPATGYVGIGTTSPGYPLHISYNPSYTTALIGLTSSYAGNVAETHLGDFGDYGAILSHNINMSNGTTSYGALSPNQFKAVALCIGGYNNPYMFAVANYPNGTRAERLVIGWNGNVGIGTKTPDGILHIVPNPTTDGGIKCNNAINGYSSFIWASNNVGLGLVAGGGLFALANPGYGFSIGSSASNTSAGAMLNVKGSGATSSTYSLKIQNSSAANMFTIRDDGNTGIGTANPSATLHIVPASVGDGGIRFNNLINGYSSMIWASNDVGFGLISGGGLFARANAGQGFSIGTSIASTSAGAMFNIKGSGATSSTYSVKIQNSSADNLFTVRDDGNVGIGTINPQAKLAVNGEIFSQKVKVTQTGWSDYVFYPGYQLRSLVDVEKYIQQHQHLPDVPSAKEVEKEGLNLGDNQATLLKKIEELTLYMIEQNKKIEAMEKEIQQLKKGR